MSKKILLAPAVLPGERAGPVAAGSRPPRRRLLRLAWLLTLTLAAAGPRSGCGDGPPVPAPWEPCGGKACGASCQLCAPGDPDCVETAVLKVCDPAGACVAEGTPFTCLLPDPCAGRACGRECVISLPCHYSSPPCEAPQYLGHCDLTGLCLAGEVGSCLPHPDCAGKACGASCNPCGPDQVCPTLIPSACDPWGRCVGEVPGLCACARKACGDACDPCDGLCMHPYASACDGTHRCQPAGSGVACGP